MIKAEIFNHRIKLNTESVASDSVKYLKIKFFTDDSWQGALKTAVFKNESLGISKAVILDNGSSLYLGDNSCNVPYEVIKPPYFTISLSGIKGETVITTLEEKIKVYQSGDTTADPPENYTPDQYEQLLSICNETKAIAESVREDANNGVFKGAKGDKGDKGADAVTDSTYNPKSKNAQSGTAVAQAITKAFGGEGNYFASAIKQNAIGEKIIANDVSPIEHPLKISVKSKNLITYPFTEKLPLTLNGITFSDNGDGTISANGTIKSGSMSNMIRFSSITLEAGTYTISANTSDSTVFLYFVAESNSYWCTSSQTITLSKKTTINLEFFVAGNYNTDTDTLVNATLRPQIEIGSTATDWISPLNLPTVTISRYGKNLANLNTGLNDSLIANPDGSYALQKTETERRSLWMPIFIPKNNPIRMSAKILEDTANVSIGVEYQFEDGSKAYGSLNNQSGTHVFTKNTNNIVKFRLYFENSLSTGAYIKFKDFQIEIGTAFSDYEPYKEVESLTPNENGKVEGFTSISPNLQLFTNNSNIVLTCEYLADTKLYIDNLIKAIS